MLRKTCVFLIRFVSQFFKTLGLRACRFHPSCSEYAAEAFRSVRLAKAFTLTASRLLRCHPFCEGGHDPLTRGR